MFQKHLLIEFTKYGQDQVPVQNQSLERSEESTLFELAVTSLVFQKELVLEQIMHRQNFLFKNCMNAKFTHSEMQKILRVSFEDFEKFM